MFPVCSQTQAMTSSGSGVLDFHYRHSFRSFFHSFFTGREHWEQSELYRNSKSSAIPNVEHPWNNWEQAEPQPASQFELDWPSKRPKAHKVQNEVWLGPARDQ